MNKTENKKRKSLALFLSASLAVTCVMGGAMAKYITSATAVDEARVAKWGVEIATWDTDDTTATSLFKANYDNTVEAGNKTDLLVAPGTKSDATIGFSVKGTPEVDFKLDFLMNVDEDVVVPAGDYLDWTTGNSTTDEFKVDQDYYPVVFTLTQTKSTYEALKLENPVVGNLADIKAAFDALSEATVEANTELDEEYTLTWEWAFETNDKADTLLGNNIAEIADDSAAGVSTELAYDIAITATQIN